MAKTDTIGLVQRAKEGDEAAQNALIERYYDRWIDRFHGELGTTLRTMHSTTDLVQSALLDAMRDIGKLRNEGAFFAWVTVIIKHKIARKRLAVRSRGTGKKARLGGARAGSQSGNLSLPNPNALPPDTELAELDEYARVTEAILELFPEYPRPMAAVVLRYLSGKSTEDLMAQLGGVSRRSVFLWLRQGLEVLKARLPDEL